MLKHGQLRFVTGDGRAGYIESAPYDVIHVGAAAPSIPQAVIARSTLSNESERLHVFRQTLSQKNVILLPVVPNKNLGRSSTLS